MADELELEAMRTDDYSWHPCQVYFSPTDCGLVIEYGNNGFQDILMNDKEAMTRIRVRSVPLLDGDCTSIKPGDRVVSQNSESETGFFDAEVEKVIKVRHSKRTTCRCTFMIKWIHRDLNGGTLTVPSSLVMKLADKNINNHPTISAFLNAVSSSNSCFSSMSPQLNLTNEFDLDLHDLLEKQIEGIKNTVDSKKRIRDEIMGLETDIFSTNVGSEKDKKSPLNPLAARAALASLMSKSNGIDDLSKSTEISLETETVMKPDTNIKKQLFSTKKAKGSDVGTNIMTPETKLRLTRAKSHKVESIPGNFDEKKQSIVTNRRLTRSVIHKEDETAAIEIPTNDAKNSSNKKRLTRSALHKEEETVAIEIPSNVTKNSSVTRSVLHKEEETEANETTTIDTKNSTVTIEIPSNVTMNSSLKRRVTRSVLHKEEETVAIETTVDTKNSTVAIKTSNVDTKSSSNKKRVTRSAIDQNAAKIETKTIKESNTGEPPRTEESNKTRNTAFVVAETQDQKGNVTSNGGSINSSKKHSVDTNKHKTLRSSPRFHAKN